MDAFYFLKKKTATQFRLFAKEMEKIIWILIRSISLLDALLGCVIIINIGFKPFTFCIESENIYPHIWHRTSISKEAAQSHYAVIIAHFCTIFNSLSYLLFFLEPFRVSDTGLRHVLESQCAVKLKELNLTNCVRIGDIVLVNINKRYW